MNCQDCIFSTRRVIVNNYVDWCSNNKSQKEITKDTLICGSFIKRNNATQKDNSKPEKEKETPVAVTEESYGNMDISKMDRRELAFEAGKALERLLERDRESYDLKLIEAFLNPIVENEKEKAYKQSIHITSSYKDFVPVKEVSKMVHVLNNSIHFYQQAEDDLKKYQRSQQDLLHAFELTDLSDEQLMEITKDLQKLRIYRRQAKNFKESLEPLYQFAMENKPLIEKIKTVQGQIDKVRVSLESRKYYVRENPSLKDAFEKAKPLHKRMNEIVGS